MLCEERVTSSVVLLAVFALTHTTLITCQGRVFIRNVNELKTLISFHCSNNPNRTKLEAILNLVVAKHSHLVGSILNFCRHIFLVKNTVPSTSYTDNHPNPKPKQQPQKTNYLPPTNNQQQPPPCSQPPTPPTCPTSASTNQPRTPSSCSTLFPPPPKPPFSHPAFLLLLLPPTPAPP